MSIITFILASTCLSLVLYARFKRRQLSNYKRYLSTNQSTRLIGFFHPYWSVLPLQFSKPHTKFDCLGLTTFLKNLFSNAGGGGERVLWTALSYMQRQQDKDHFLVYTGDDMSKQEMLGKVKVTSFSSLLHSTFGLVLTEGARTESIRDRIGSREDRFRSIDKEVVGRRFNLSSFNPLGSEFRQYRIGDRSNLASRT